MPVITAQLMTISPDKKEMWVGVIPANLMATGSHWLLWFKLDNKTP